jgi:hypothetical protein
MKNLREGFKRFRRDSSLSDIIQTIVRMTHCLAYRRAVAGVARLIERAWPETQWLVQTSVNSFPHIAEDFTILIPCHRTVRDVSCTCSVL